MYEIYCKLRDRAGLTDYAVSKQTGVGRSTFSDWKIGRSSPKQDKMQKIADFFGVSVEYLATGKETEKQSDSGKSYYFSDATAAAAQEIYEDKDLHALFDAAKYSRPEDLKMAADLLKRLKETNPDG